MTQNTTSRPYQFHSTAAVVHHLSCLKADIAIFAMHGESNTKEAKRAAGIVAELEAELEARKLPT